MAAFCLECWNRHGITDPLFLLIGVHSGVLCAIMGKNRKGAWI